MALAAAVALGCVEHEQIDFEHSVVVGLMLPFAGKDAAIGRAYERAALLARDRANEAGGVDGKRLEFITRDTHSDAERAVAQLREILAYDAVAVIGPESYEIAQAALPLLAEKQVPLVSPVISAARAVEVPAEYRWYRLAPSAALLAQSFANYAAESAIATVSVVYTSEDYNVDFAEAFIERFERRGGGVELSLHLTEDKLGYGEEVKELGLGESDNIVLCTATDTAARFVNDVTLNSTRTDWNWYLAPPLETPALLHNTLRGALEGALGIGIDIFDESAEFIAEYQQAWRDTPIEGAYYYYDAVALLALSIELALADTSDREWGEVLQEAVSEIARPNGIQVGWDYLGRGLSRIRDGDQVYYSGLTGPLRFNREGQQRLAPMKIWRITGGDFVKHEAR